MDCDIDIVTAGPPGSAIRGQIQATADSWLLTNLSPDLTCVVENLEFPDEYISIPPGRADAPIPFELARITTLGAPPEAALLVFGPEPKEVPANPSTCSATQPAGTLTPDTKHFHVLIALCAPRLVANSQSGMPRLSSSTEIVGRLAEAGVDMTERSVDAHIDYLVKKLRLAPADNDPGESRPPGWKRDLLARVALRHRLVRPEHLERSRG